MPVIQLSCWRSSMWVHFELTVWCKNSHRDGKFWGKRSRRMMALHPSIHNFLPPDIWSEQSFQTDPDLPPGWKKITDMAGIYYWHIPTGTTQWERPATHPQPPGQMESTALGDHSASTPRKPSLGSLSPSPTPDHEVRDMHQTSHYDHCGC